MRPILTLFSGLTLMLATACAGLPEPAAPVGPGREIVQLTDGWRFHPGDPGEAAAGAGFEDAGWEAVSLPHSWNALGEYRLERTAATRNVQGVGWYRRTFDAADLPPGARRYIQFDGVGNIAEVWLNGVRLGEHAGAFSRFRFEITDALRPGENVLAVRADNSERKPGSSTEHVVPLLGDFFIHGGLYRGVSLIGVGEAHIDLMDHGGPGLYLRALSLDDDLATVQARIKVAGARPGLRLELDTRDAEGRWAGRTYLPATSGEVTAELIIDQPRRWDGRADPHLYRVTATLLDGERVLDRVEQPLGLRTFRIDADEGFILNGRRLPLHGVSRHQDWLGRGWAITRAEHERDMELIEEIGANTVRFAHYQHAPEWFELSDEAGMIVWAELPFVNKVAFDDSEASPELVANARQQMIELIRQNYNHPSVVTWGIGNEVDIDLAFGRLGPRADARPLLRELNALSHAEDPDRPTVIADCCEATPGDKVDYLPVLTGEADLMGYNRYYGWYYGAVDDLGPHLDALRAAHPDVPLSVSEYGAGGALSQHTDNPEGGPINAGGRPHPEEFQSWIHERSWPQIESRPWLWGSWIWNMFDFSSTVRQEGDARDVNDKGLVTFDRAVKKDAFFYYKSQWSDEPVLHITGRRYVERAWPVTHVRIYSNAGRVSLSLNGRPLGEADCPGRICVFPEVALAPGDNRLEARAVIGGVAQVDVVDWTAPNAAHGLAINVGDLAGYVGEDGARVGSDHWFSGGTARRLGGAAAQALDGAGDPRMRTGLREGTFGYSIPLPDGRWRVTLLFVEPEAERTAPRDIRVTAEGRGVLDGFDPASAAGGVRRGVERRFDVEVADGRLDLAFTGEAVLSGITVRPAD
ncbi:malectin domain-containing carbohydrate-binding protein [Roseibacterium beibuensis]|uniref:glycoside hydrolase family 2 TIM barrel-domain containing protein n=1 Tax=[Roseibacterium] beibuensis TaxID=1193142 RepID=UPI00217E780F|nr:glycoside hydrolase family 2 TIM barrel-domain containing protein [Roseibacterium beibuensis]MCS6625559.1 malectin domain-containing carbohydrate-binding protein [Roseibacterium beibuensis]